jgi:hypothetical protein
MTRLLCVLTVTMALPMSAAAQGIPPLPPAPPVPPAPAVVPAPPLPPLPPLPPAPAGRGWDLQRLDEFHWQWDEAAKIAADQIRIQFDTQRLNLDDQLMNLNVKLANLGNFRPGAFEFQRPVVARVGNDAAGLYNNGLSALQRRQYDRAITFFDRVVTAKGPYADAATYWKAFSQARLVRTDDALATLAALRRDYPQSRYLGEASVLEADVRRLAGQQIDPQTLDANDELKLIAINGIANTDPDRAIPLLEGVLNAANTLGNKRRALFVLALSDDPRAHQILLRYAKGAGSPELQVDAIRNLISRRERKATDTELREIYEATADASIRRAIIDAYAGAGDKPALVAIVRNKAEQPDIKRSAISRLSGLAEPGELWALYQQEPDAQLRLQMINVFASMDATDQLLQAARTDKDPNVRLRAVRTLGNQRREQSGALLVDLYGGETDRNARRAIVSVLRSQANAEGLVAIARKESDLTLKREIVTALSAMAPKNKVAADFLMDVIK